MDNVLGNDIKLVIEEVGEPISVYNYETETWFPAKIDPERHWESRRPFENEYEVICTFPYDTVAKPGYIINIPSDNTHYLLASMVSEYFEGFIITKECFLYKCNTKFWLQRRNRDAGRDENYKLINEWPTLYDAHYALFTFPIEHLSIHSEDHARFSGKKKHFMVSSFVDIKIGDKITVEIDNDPWTVEIVESSRLKGVNFCQLGAFSG